MSIQESKIILKKNININKIWHPESKLVFKSSKEKLQASVTKTGKIRTGVDVTPTKILQAAIFGGSAPKEVREFYKGSGVPFGEVQTSNAIALSKDKDILLKDILKAMQAVREADAKKKDDISDILKKMQLDKKEKDNILKSIYGFKVGAEK